MLRGLTVIGVGMASLAGAAAAFDAELVKGLESSAVFVTVPGPRSGFETIIRLDILPTNTLCNSSRIQFFGQPLPAQAERDDVAPDSAPESAAPTLLSHWTTQCNPSEGSMEARLGGATEDGHPWSVTLALDRIKVTRCFADGGLPWTFFEKTGGDWDSILTVDPKVDDTSPIDGESEGRQIWVPAQTSLPEQNSAEDRASASTDSFEEQTQLGTKEQQPKARCEDWRCLAHNVMDSLQSKASSLYHLRPAPNAQRPISSMTFAELPQKMMRPVTTTTVPHAASPTSSTACFMDAADQDLLMTLSIAAVAFTIFSFLGIAVLGARRYVSSDIQRLPCHRESREERLARVANRRHAIKAFFQKLLCGVFGFAEKASSTTPQGRDLRSDSANNNASAEETTLEDDIAGFRAVADILESLVAVEEGRAPSFDYDNGQPPRDEDDVPPPSYESDLAEGSMVADGFRYTPGGNAYYPQSTPATSSDRLRYDTP